MTETLKITLLTSWRFDPAIQEMIRCGRGQRVELMPGASIQQGSHAVYPWRFNHGYLLNTVRTYCAHKGIALFNPYNHSLKKLYQKCRELGYKTPRIETANCLAEAKRRAAAVGYPLLLQSFYASHALPCQVIENEAQLSLSWNRKRLCLTSYSPFFERIVCLTVIGNQVADAYLQCLSKNRAAAIENKHRTVKIPIGHSPEIEKMAVQLCNALTVHVGQVRLAPTADGPVILSLSQRGLHFDRDCMNPKAGYEKWIKYLTDEIQKKRMAPIAAGARRIHLICEDPAADFIHKCRQQAEALSYSVSAGGSFDANCEAVILVSSQADLCRSAIIKSKLCHLPLLKGPDLSLWQQRSLLRQAGLPTVRCRLVKSRKSALKVSKVLGYPCYIRSPRLGSAGRPIPIMNEKQLSAVWEAELKNSEATDSNKKGFRCIIEEFAWGTKSILFICVAGRQIIDVRIKTRPDQLRPLTHCEMKAISPAQLDSRQKALAIQATEVTGCAFAWIEMTDSLDDPQICAMHGNIQLSNHLSQRQVTGFIRQILDRIIKLDQASPGGDVPAQASAGLKKDRLNVAIPRPFSGRGKGPRVWHIYALYKQLVRKGHHVAYLNKKFDPDILDHSDLILQDPLHAFGFQPGADRFNWRLMSQFPAKSHLLRARKRKRTDKRSMFRLARRLNIPSPALHHYKRLSQEDFPVITKPNNGSLGRGVKLAYTVNEVVRAAKRGDVVQRYIDPKISYAVNIRVISVMDRIAAAALFYHRDALRANLSRGGQAIALTGPGRLSSCSAEEALILEKVGIDARKRCLPQSIAAMAAKIGTYYSARGVQIIGHDYIVDDRQNWYFLEINTAFGLAVFNVTHGDGAPSHRRGFRYAGPVLEKTMRQALGKMKCLIVKSQAPGDSYPVF